MTAPGAPDPVSLRPYAGRRDHAEMVRVRNAALRGNGQPGDATVEGMDAKYANLQQDLALDCAIAEIDQRIVAYARTSAEDLASDQRQAAIIILADPDAPEVERAVARVFEVSLRRALQQLEAMRADRPTRILCSFPASDGASQSAAEAAGFREARRESVLVVEALDAVPAVALPEGFSLVRVDRADRALQRQLFDAALRMASDRWDMRASADGWFGALIDAPGFDPSLWRAAFRGNDIAGVVVTDLEASGPGPRVAWTELLAVDVKYRESGLARALLADTLRDLHGVGATSAAINVDLLDPGQDEGLFTSLGYRVASVTLEYLAGPFAPGTLPTVVGGRIEAG